MLLLSYPQHEDTESRVGVVTREANYHPDGGQIVCPTDQSPFVALLALPKDDVTPGDFVAFYCDGSFGIHINANVWHQPVYPINNEAAFWGKQVRPCSVCVCVCVCVCV